MYICVILRQGQKLLVPCERNITSDTLKGLTINYLNWQRDIVVGAQIIMDISKFFNSSSKKRELTDQSCSGEEPKKAREGSLNDSNVSLDDVFTKV